jgi:hypothetical protein
LFVRQQVLRKERKQKLIAAVGVSLAGHVSVRVGTPLDLSAGSGQSACCKVK